MNNDQSTGMSWLAVLFIIIVIAALFGGFGNGFGFGRGNMPYPVNDTGCNRVSNCEVEKQEIIDTARTQYLIEQQSNDTRMAINASTEAITSQARWRTRTSRTASLPRSRRTPWRRRSLIAAAALTAVWTRSRAAC